MEEIDESEANLVRGPAGERAGFGLWLSLAAAPTFGVMALLAILQGNGASMICSSTLSVFPLDGMPLMYLLMSAFHLPPWLKIASGAKLGAIPD